MVWAVFLIFDAGDVLTECLLGVFQFALQTFDVRVLDHLIIWLLGSNSPPQRLHFMIGLALNSVDLLLFAEAPNLVDVLKHGVHQSL